MGEHAAVIPQVGQRRDIAGRRLIGRDHHVKAGADQGANGHDLDHGEPELQFTEHLHGQQVERKQQAYTTECRQPLRDIREPEL
ncbi:hypothetical protein D3C77_700990 [compost metagenome]